MTHFVYICSCHKVICFTLSIWLPWSNPRYVIAIYSKMLPYNTHTVVTYPYLRQIVLPKIQRSHSLSPDNVAKWCQSSKITESVSTVFILHSNTALKRLKSVTVNLDLTYTLEVDLLVTPFLIKIIVRVAGGRPGGWAALQLNSIEGVLLASAITPEAPEELGNWADWVSAVVALKGGAEEFYSATWGAACEAWDTAIKAANACSKAAIGQRQYRRSRYYKGAHFSRTFDDSAAAG